MSVMLRQSEGMAMRRTKGQVFQWYRANVHSEIAQFRRSLGRVEALMQSGRFWRLAEATRAAMQRMLAVLYRRLSELQRRAVTGLAGAFLALGLLAAPLAAEPVTFVEQTGVDNPFDGDPGLFERAALVFTDVDDDGDQDAVVGVSNFKYYPGTADLLLYRKDRLRLIKDTIHDPFDTVDINDTVDEESASPAVADLDADGDMDVFVGGGHYYRPDEQHRDGMLMYRRDAPEEYAVALGVDSPLSSLSMVSSKPYFPAFADIDGDGDVDFFVGVNDGYGYVQFYRNDGGEPPVFVASDTDNPLDGVEFVGFPAPAFVEIDNDGDLDAFVGEGTYDGYTAAIRFFENTGSRTVPDFVERSGTDNPLDGFAGSPITDYPAPTFVDFDDDGDMDAFVGGGEYVDSPYYPFYGWEGRIQYYKNTNPVVVTAAAQAATDAAGQFVSVQSNKFAGLVYIVRDGTPQSSPEDLEAAWEQHEAARAAVSAANADVQISTFGLIPGTYHAYAVSGGATPESVQLSATGTNAIAVSIDSYPASEGLDSSDVWIEKVTIGSLVNDSGNDGGYEAFTDSVATLARGTSVTIELVPGFKPGARYSIRRLSQQVWRVWVDWNSDSDFADDGEEALGGGPSQRALSATITVPQTALLGSTRIRVSMRYAGDGAPLAEGTFEHGEVEDYTATVTE